MLETLVQRLLEHPDANAGALLEIADKVKDKPNSNAQFIALRLVEELTAILEKDLKEAKTEEAQDDAKGRIDYAMELVESIKENVNNSGDTVRMSKATSLLEELQQLLDVGQ